MYDEGDSAILKPEKRRLSYPGGNGHLLQRQVHSTYLISIQPICSRVLF